MFKVKENVPEYFAIKVTIENLDEVINFLNMNAWITFTYGSLENYKITEENRGNNIELYHDSVGRFNAPQGSYLVKYENVLLQYNTEEEFNTYFTPVQ